MVRRLLALIITLLLLGGAGPVQADSADLLERRSLAWPSWTLPAPLPRPSRKSDLIYPNWFAGTWDVSSQTLDPASATTNDAAEPLRHQARFVPRGDRLIGDRAFNAQAIGEAVLGPALLAVEQPASDTNRQLARISGDRLLETTVIGRRQSDPNQSVFYSDELVLQILHGPGAPRISRVETLSRYQPCEPLSSQPNRSASVQRICADQWQARYIAPGEGSAATPLAVNRYRLELRRQQDPSAGAGFPADHASGTRAATADGR